MDAIVSVAANHSLDGLVADIRDYIFDVHVSVHITEMSSFRAHNFDISEQKSPSFCFCRILKLAASLNSLRNDTGFRNCWNRKRLKDFHEWSNDMIGPLVPSHTPIHLLHPLFYVSIYVNLVWMLRNSNLTFFHGGSCA